MIFTQQELICFNSMLDGKTIFGTHFKAPQNVDEQYIGNTVASLRGKGFLDDENQPNKLFAVAVKMLETHKQANTHVFMNKARIALGETKITVLTETQEGYDLSRVDKFLFYQGLLAETPFWCEADNGKQETKAMTPEEWNRELAGADKFYDNFWLHKFEQKKLVQTQIMYRKEGQGCIYCPEKQTLTYCGPRLMRVTVMDMLGIKAVRSGADG